MSSPLLPDQGHVEAPRARRRRRSWALDVSLAVFVLLLSTSTTLIEDRPGPIWFRLLLLVALSVPLVLRRLRPVPVLAWLLVLATTTALVEPRLGTPFPIAVALYSVVASGPRRRGLIAAGATEFCILLASLAPNGGGFPGIVQLSAMTAAVLGLGLYTGARRALLAELRDRAARLERERDQQGALAAAAERARIAREMHDVVAHHLTVMVALSDGAAAASATDPARAGEVMRTVSSTGRQALTDTRRLLGVLRDADGELAEAALAPLVGMDDLDALLGGVRAAGLPVTLEVTGTPVGLPPVAQATVYRVVQEALTNTLKHAGAGARARVRIEIGEREVCLEVTDDGAGSQAPVPAGIGRGLHGMRERVRAFDGRVDAGPRAGGGWQVSARLGLDPRDRGGVG